MIKKTMVIMALLILAVTMLATGCAPKAEPIETPAQFFKGKTIDLIANEDAGSLTDLMARVLATHLAEGTGATVIVTNRRGAGGLEGMNFLYEAKPDGLTLGVASTVKSVANKVLNEPAAAYEIEKYSYIMSIGYRPNFFFVSPDGPSQSVASLQAAKGLKFGGGSASGYVSLAGLTVIKTLGLDAKVITGFTGGAERALAVKRGEIIGYVINMSGAAPYVEAGMIKPLFALATERDPLMPDVPAITELVNLTDENRTLVKLWETTLVGSTLFAASPALPDDRLTYLRNLASQWVQEKRFREEVNTVSNYELQVQEYITGGEVAGSMLGMAATMDKFQAIFAEMIEKYRD